MATRPRLSGAEKLPNSFWTAYHQMCDRHGWDAGAIAAVMHIESGFQPDAGINQWSPKRTASGLIQFIETTARGLGAEPTTIPPPGLDGSKGEGRAWATWTILKMSAEDQLDYVEAYFERAGANSSWRPVDYYCATWGTGAGQSLATVLAMRGDDEYEANKALDANSDGRITIADLAEFIDKHYPGGWTEVLQPPAPTSSPPPDAVAVPASGGSGFTPVILGIVFTTLVTVGTLLLRKVRR